VGNTYRQSITIHSDKIGNMNRERMWSKIGENNSSSYDFIIIGGGASGTGIVLEAVSRGYSAALFEKSDFVKSTSSKSTKLVHGGVRYLAQGDLALVREACVERGLLLRNAPHLVRNQSFIIPAYGLLDEILYTAGLKIYDMMAGKYSLGRSRRISRKDVIGRLPSVSEKNLSAGILYYDGQFDDSRLAINVLQTAAGLGAVTLNYAPVEDLTKDVNGRLDGVRVRDLLTGNHYDIKGRVIINATGIFADEIMQLDTPGKKSIIRPSQGIHLVVENSFLPGNDAIMIPKTDDGRVLFAVPWHGKVVMGTTDTPIEQGSLEPVALKEEIEFILATAARYLKKAPRKDDILSIFAGLRPLAADGKNNKTKEISRSHKIVISKSGLMTMIGGKWTTFRKMGEDLVTKAEKINGWSRTRSQTKKLRIKGYLDSPDVNDPLYVYGSDKEGLLDLVRNDRSMGDILSESLQVIKAQVVWAVREEMAVNVEDVLSRRTRCQLLDAGESLHMAPEVARIMAQETGRGDQWIGEQIAAYREVTLNYMTDSRKVPGSHGD
jgi:glycerol-3-phosphate dehydrogenase